jgi:hypothetical protein
MPVSCHPEPREGSIGMRATGVMVDPSHGAG